MPGARSRQGCEECRGRRRKCDEKKPVCGQCSLYTRQCNYTLKVVWDVGRKPKKAAGLQASGKKQSAHSGDVASFQVQPSIQHAVSESESTVITTRNEPPAESMSLPRSLPNGLALPPRYRRLLNYFTHDILASLSVHPSVHDDLCRGLVPATLHSPQLLSACLALSAAGFLSRGISDVDGIEIPRILGHLQSSGLSLLRTALGNGQMNETLLATCLIWCLADVFTHRQGSTSWRIHLQGIKAILDGNQAYRYFAAEAGGPHSAMRHLYLLYQSLQTLPHVPSRASPESMGTVHAVVARGQDFESASGANIDGFLGYSEELLHVLQQVNHMSGTCSELSEASLAQADILLGKVNAMINRDTQTPPDVSLISSLSPEYGREFSLCHRSFQQATLIHLYRRLYHLPSRAESIQVAVEKINGMVGDMTQAQPCHTWVAMAMPLFTVGCEAFTETQQQFALDKIHKLETCIGSFHVQSIRQALKDIWKMRRDAGDLEGDICAGDFLEKLDYNIILF